MEPRSRRKEKIGTVVKDGTDKTIAVRIDRTTSHPIYKRIVRRSNKVTVHDEKNGAKLGDKVRIQEVSPMSKNKRWCLVEVLKQARSV